MLLLVLIVRLLPEAVFGCDDDLYKNCKERTEAGDCEGDRYSGVTAYQTTLSMLSECRKSCWDKFSGSDPAGLPRIINLYGGVEDHVLDDFGFKIPICSERDGGLTAEGRRILLNLIAMNKKQAYWVPRFTEQGFEKVRIPEAVYNVLKVEHQMLEDRKQEERCIPSVINCLEIQEDEEAEECSLKTKQKTFMMKPSSVVEIMIEKELHPLAEKWSKVKLEHTSTYGIRRYTNGSWLTSHVDRFNTHVISAILNVAQDVREDWPLYIKDNDGGDHAVIIKPGEMLWYESARLIHGRPKPLNGDYFDNLFIHFKPVGDWYEEPFTVGSRPRRDPITLQDLKQ